MERQDGDLVDTIIEQWGRERPDLDSTGMEVAARVFLLARRLERRLDEVLAPLGLTLWQFDVLATLRRSGPPYQLSPTRLMQASMLSSGAMTNRLDRLEAAGLVRREADPNDRRGLRISLTPEGHAVINRAIAARFEEARRNCRPLTDAQRTQLADLLRALLVADDQD